MALPTPDDEVRQAVAIAFDVDFYRATNRDLDLTGKDPVRHYLTAGWRQGRDPAPWFSAAGYLAANPDVAQAEAEPLSHFLTRGRHEGREIVPSRDAEAYLFVDLNGGRTRRWRFQQFGVAPAGAQDGARREAESEPLARDRDLLAAEFDAAFYLNGNADVAASGIDPLDHFLTCGWQEGRDPTRSFSVRDYLDNNPDVAQSGMNPFVHFVRTGRAEGRGVRSDLGFRYEILSRLKPVATRVEAVRAAQAGVAMDGIGTLAAALSQARTGLRDLHLTFSHDDYAAHLGGVQLCLRREAAGMAKLGRDHLHIFPARAWPVVRTADEPGALGVLLNGRPAGTFAAATIVEALRDTAGAGGGQRSFAIHSLLGHAAQETVDIVRAVGLEAGFFWLHDFASLCAGFHLMRNDVEDCAAPAPDSAACSICIYGDFRARHLEEHRRLFEDLRLTVVSPSESALALWSEAWDHPASATLVRPHLRLAERGPAPAVAAERPFRLAFAGFPVAHKGWPIFRDLAARHADDPRYVFLHLGGHTPGDLPIDFHEVMVSEARPDAMREALEEVEADAVLVWSLCRETFSLSAHEAAAAGAAVITGPDSGNVAAFVRASGLGLVLSDEAALAGAFESGAILDWGRARRRPRLYDLVHGGLTAELVSEGVLSKDVGP